MESRPAAPKAKTKAKAKDKVINRDQGLRQGHDEPCNNIIFYDVNIYR